jgi:hypothetical protein
MLAGWVLGCLKNKNQLFYLTCSPPLPIIDMDCNIGFDYISWYGHPAYNKKTVDFIVFENFKVFGH